jgi:hypothetical protein
MKKNKKEEKHKIVFKTFFTFFNLSYVRIQTRCKRVANPFHVPSQRFDNQAFKRCTLNTKV